MAFCRVEVSWIASYVTDGTSPLCIDRLRAKDVMFHTIKSLSELLLQPLS